VKGGAIPYFAYGTLQEGSAHYPRMEAVLGRSVGRVRTAEPHGLVLAHEPACSNPGCDLLHRMVMLVPGVERLHVEGDLFLVDGEGLALLDRLEGIARDGDGPYVRDEIGVISLDGSRRYAAQAHRARSPQRWLALVDAGAAQLLASCPRNLAGGERKPCCTNDPGHAGPHDIVDPLDEPFRVRSLDATE
jgi:hypothetical protein